MEGRDNNLDFIRWFKATAVILSHAWPISGLAPFTLWPFIPNLGGWAVNGFFALSGFLILRSRERSNLWAFIVKRIARIYPAALVVTLFVAFIVSPLGGAQRWHTPWEIIWNGLTLGILPSVGGFQGLKQQSLNGSMWTIRYEDGCYAMVAILFAMGFFKYRFLGLLSALSLATLENLRAKHFIEIPAYFGADQFNQWPKLGFCYMLGCVIYQYRDKIKLNGWVALALVLSIGLRQRPEFNWLFPSMEYAAWVYAIFYLGFKTKPVMKNWAKRTGDLSYGTYLYAWPVQMLIAYHLGVPPIWNFFLTALIVTVLALLSWRFVEHPSMEAARRRLVPSTSRDYRTPAVEQVQSCPQLAQTQ